MDDGAVFVIEFFVLYLLIAVPFILIGYGPMHNWMVPEDGISYVESNGSR